MRTLVNQAEGAIVRRLIVGGITFLLYALFLDLVIHGTIELVIYVAIVTTLRGLRRFPRRTVNLDLLRGGEMNLKRARAH
jgi:hypothetical protein